MSSVVCGACNLDYHVKGYGKIWVEGVGWHKWQAPSQLQIQQRLRKHYGLI